MCTLMDDILFTYVREIESPIKRAAWQLVYMNHLNHKLRHRFLRTKMQQYTKKISGICCVFFFRMLHLEFA